MRQNLSAPLATSSAGAAGRHGAVPRGAAHTGAAASQKHRTNVPAPGAHAACRSRTARRRAPTSQRPRLRLSGRADPRSAPRPDGRGPRRRPPPPPPPARSPRPPEPTARGRSAAAPRPPAAPPRGPLPPAGPLPAR